MRLLRRNVERQGITTSLSNKLLGKLLFFPVTSQCIYFRHSARQELWTNITNTASCWISIWQQRQRVQLGTRTWKDVYIIHKDCVNLALDGIAREFWSSCLFARCLDHFQGFTPLLKVNWPNNVSVKNNTKTYTPDHRNGVCNWTLSS